MVRVETPVLGVEGGDELAEPLRRHRSLAEWARELEALMLVAQVGRALEAHLLARHLLARQPYARLRLELRPRGFQRVHCGGPVGHAAIRGAHRAHEAGADVGVEQPPRREDAGALRNDHRGNVEQLGEPAGMEWTRTAEGHE